MAKNKILQQKKKGKGPIKDCGKAAKEIIRIRNNERARLRRREKKLLELPRKTPKKKLDLLRKDIRGIKRGLSQIGASLNKANTLCSNFTFQKQERKILKGTITRMGKSLEKMYEAGEYGDKYKQLNNKYFAAKRKLAEVDKKLNSTLISVNKLFGLGYGEMGELMTKREYKELQRTGKLSQEDEDDILAAHPEYKRDYKEVIDLIADEQKELTEQREQQKIEVEFDWVMSQVFWQIWRDFDKNEVDKLHLYTEVLFVNEFGEEVVTGEDGPGGVGLEASKYWKHASEIGSDVIVTKYLSVDRTILKYVIEDL